MSNYASFTLQAVAGTHADIHASLTTALGTEGLTLDEHASLIIVLGIEGLILDDYEDTGLYTYNAGTVQISAFQQSSTDAVWTDFVVDTSNSNLDAATLVTSLKALWTTPKRVLLTEWRSGPDKLGFPANTRKTLRRIRDNIVWWDWMSLPSHHFAGHQPPTVDPDAPEEDVRDMEAITADQIVTEFLRPVGGGNKNLKIQDGSVNAVVYEFGPPIKGKRAVDNYISTVVITIEDQNIQNNQFGGMPRLANGCIFQVVDADDNVLQTFNDGVAIKDMLDMAAMAGTVPNFDDQVTGLDSWVVEWSLVAHTGGFLLALRPGDKFQVIVQDDLTTINNFTVQLKGTLAL